MNSNASGVPTLGRWLPGLAFLAFFLLTVALFFWGPWDYPTDDGLGPLVLFLVGVHLAFIVGYWRGIQGTPARATLPIRPATLVLIAAGAELLLLFPTSAFNTGHWIPRPGAAIEDLAAAYTGSLALRDAGRPYANYARMLLAPVLALGVPLGVFYWRRLSWGTRLLFAASVVGTIALFVAMGANAGAAHWMAVFPWFVLAAHLAGVNRLTARGWAGAAGVQVVSLLFFVLLFTATMNQRTGSFAKYGQLPGIGASLVVSESADADGPTRESGAGLTASPTATERSRLRVGFDGLAAYLSQGYFAVYLSLKEPFVPGYGVGNSVFLQRQVARVLGDERVLGRSYPERIQARGWNAYGYWATIYPWIASDVTFPGTVLVMGLIGWLTARVWLDLLGGNNPLAVALFGQLLILLYYVPGHNKIMHSGESAIAFLALVLAWVVTRRSEPVGRDVGVTGPHAPVHSEAVVAVVGSLVPDEPRFHGPAFNRASQMFQDELVRGLAVAGLVVDRVFSMEPLVAFPRGRRVFTTGGTATTRSGRRVRLLPYINVPVVKALTVGISTFLALVGWAWRQRNRTRIIHVFNLMMPPGGAVWLAARLTGSRVTVSVLDVWRPGALVPDTWAWRADFRMQQMLMPRFDGHMVVTPAIRDDLLPGRRVCVLEGGIAPDRFQTVSEASPFPRRPGTFRMVLSGSLERFNGVDLALEAMTRLPADVELVIAGSGSLAEAVRERARQDPRITFAGFLSFEEVLALYRTADLLLNARITHDIDTRYFFPSKLMELLASGVPVLSTCTGPVEAEYGDVVYLLRDETPDGFAASILEIRAMAEDERRQRGARAREFMFTEKTWERQARRLAQYLQKEVVETLPA